jgi:hypothetical protein
MRQTRWLALALGLFLAPAGCATSEVADPGAGGDDGADQGAKPAGDLGWLADRATFIGSLEPTSSTDTDGEIQYSTDTLAADLRQGGFHKFTLPTLQGAGFESMACGLEEETRDGPTLWPAGSQPVVCLMGPTFHDCETRVENITNSDGTKERRWSFAHVPPATRWMGATLLVVTSRQNLEQREAVDKGASTYTLHCSYFDAE